MSAKPQRIKRKKKRKRKERKETKKTFTWIQTNVQRCSGRAAPGTVQRCERSVGETSAYGMLGWFGWLYTYLFLYNFYLKYSSKSTDRIFPWRGVDMYLFIGLWNSSDSEYHMRI